MGHKCSGVMYVEVEVLVMVFGCREGKLRVVVDRVSCHRRWANDVARDGTTVRYKERMWLKDVLNVQFDPLLVCCFVGLPVDGFCLSMRLPFHLRSALTT